MLLFLLLTLGYRMGNCDGPEAGVLSDGGLEIDNVGEHSIRSRCSPKFSHSDLRVLLPLNGSVVGPYPLF